MLLASGVIGLYMVDRLPIWIMIVLVARDTYMLWGSWQLEKHHLRLAITFLGKLTTTVLLVGFALLIWGKPTVSLPVLGDDLLGMPLVYVGLAMSLTAAVDYTLRGRKAVAADAGE